MERNRVDRLNEGQRECLRMVYRHMETKEIARILGISPDGVAQRIKTAMRILGVHRRRDAARILAESEGANSYLPSVNPPWDIAAAAEPAKIPLSFEGGRQRRGAPSGEALQEERIAFEVSPLPQAATLPFPTGGARPNDVEWPRRLAWIAGIAIGGSLAFGALVAAVEALVRLVRG